MKVGIFTPYLDSLSGGEKYMLTIAECLSHHFLVNIFWDPKKAEEIKKKANLKLAIDLSKVTFVENIFARNIPLLQRIIRSKKYDKIIYLSDGSIPFLACDLIVHFQFPVEWVSNNPITAFKLKRVEKIICNSQFTQSFIDKRFGTHSLVLYPPVDSPKTKKIEKENYILNVGRFLETSTGSYFKKQDILINAFKQLFDSGGTKWKLNLAISLTDEEKNKLGKLEKMARDLPVQIYTNLNREELLSLYNKSKIYWHASGFGENLEKYPERAEHFGITTVEAMSYGIVPVVINAGGQKEIVEEKRNGYLWNSVDELVKKTNALINDKTLWEKLSRNAKEDSKKFYKEHFCESLFQIINEK